MKSSKNSTWCEDEDRIIVGLVKTYGVKNWAKVAEELDNNGYKKKSGKQCRERWHNHLDPKITKNGWTPEEEEIMFREHKKHGNKWTLIAESLPGRTDNSIKNYFYSTIRRSLRRMNKMLGSKNSTMKMRKIKPSTLSKVFALAEGRVSAKDLDQEKGVDGELRENCKQILHHLMEFAKWKPVKANETMGNEDLGKFQRVMEEMIKINDLYENEKAREAKVKRQRKLQKNFDQVVASEEDSSLEHDDPGFSQPESDASPCPKQMQTTRSNRKVKPPSQYNPTPDKLRSRGSFEMLEGEGKKPEFISTSFNLEQQLAPHPHEQIIQQSQEEEKSDKSAFNLDLDEDNFQIDHMAGSPSFRNTPFALTPIQGIFGKEMPFQPLKNEDCNQELLKIIMRVQKNTDNPAGSNKNSSRFHSPASAFRQYT